MDVSELSDKDAHVIETFRIPTAPLLLQFVAT